MYIINPYAIIPGGGAGFDSSYQDVLNRATALGYTLPDAGNQTLQNQLVVDLKAAGIWSGLDVFYPMLTNINFARINWKTPASNLITFPGATPTYSTTNGFTGNASSMYLSTNWIPSSGPNYTLNNAGHGCYIVVNGTDERNIYGTSNAADDSTNAMNLRPRAASGFSNSRINSGQYAAAASVTDSTGFWHIQRLASNSVTHYQNGTNLQSNTFTSTGMSNNAVYILAENQNGTVSNYNANNIHLFWAGSNLSGLTTSFSNIINAFY